MNSFNKLVRDKIPEIINEHFMNFSRSSRSRISRLAAPFSRLIYCTQERYDPIKVLVMKIEDTPTSNNSAATAPSGLGRARRALAISAGKLAGASGRLLRIGGGTSLPG